MYARSRGGLDWTDETQGRLAPRYQALLGNAMSLKLCFVECKRDSEEEAELPRHAFPSGAWERGKVSELGNERI